MSGITILVIDDDASIHTAVERRLEGVVDEVLKADSPTKGLRMAIQDKPDVILLDVNMPQIDGFKVCRLLQENPATRDIPIVFLTADENPANLAKALDAGASDYISKPFNAIELEARVRVALRTKQMIDLLQEKARIDALTGLHNRAQMDDALVAATSAFHRTGQSFALLMIDLDHFKPINDTYGHAAGDQILLEVRDLLLGACRKSDFVIRWGGDEFVVIAKQSNPGEAEALAERIRSTIAGHTFSMEGGQIVRTTCSIGFAAYPIFSSPRDEDSLDQIINLADSLMYEAKKQRNAWAGMLGISEAATSEDFDLAGLEPTSLLFRARREGNLGVYSADCDSQVLAEQYAIAG